MSSSIYSTRGSYIGVKQYADETVWFLSLHGKSKPHQKVIEIQLTKNNEVVPITFNIDSYSAEISTENFGISIYMDSESRLVMKPFGESFQVEFHVHPQSNFEYNTLWKAEIGSVGIINSYKSLTKYLLYNRSDTLSLSQDMHYDSKGSRSQSDATSVYKIDIQNDSDCIYLEECLTNFHKPTFPKISSSKLQKEAEQDFMNVLEQFETKDFSSTRLKSVQKAVQILRTNTVESNGLLTCEATVASVIDFPSVYSWDNGFIALGTMLIDPNLGFNQLKAAFDHQDSWGQLPGSVSDSTIRWNFSKPPTVGFVLLEMLKYEKLTQEQMVYLYNRLIKWVDYHLNYRKSSNTGCFFYSHGNDSGMDNSTVFRHEITVESPDLSVYLLLCMEALLKIENQIEETNQLNNPPFNIKQEEKHIKKELLAYLYDGNSFFARNQVTGEKINSDSLLLAMPILLKDPKISEPITQEILEKYLTQYGVATEKLESELYEEDAYWRGAIWAPSTALIAGGFERNNQLEVSQDIMQKFCRLVEENGFYENYGAHTGKGLRDQDFSWTAGVYLYFLYKLYGK